MLDDTIILLAEDDAGHANLIQRNLKRAALDNRVIVFQNGQKVIDFLYMHGDGARRQPHKSYVLILDIRMPVMNGMEVLETIKADEKLKQIPVVVITTTDEPETIDRCEQLGCADFITKPADYEELAPLLRKMAQFLKTIEVPQLT